MIPAELRTTSTVWLIPFLLIIAIWYEHNQIFPADGYAVAASATANIVLFLIASVIATASAWEGSRWARSGMLRYPSPRPRFIVIARIIGPSALTGIVVYVVAMVAGLRSGGGAGWPDGRVLAIGCSAMLAAALAGFTLGTRVHPVVALPTAFLATFFWLAFPRALHPDWLVSLNGDVSRCCTNAQDLAPRAVIATIGINVAVIVVCLVLLTSFAAFRPVTAGTICLALMLIAAGSGAWLVHGLGPAPVVARTSGLACARTAVRICVWREHDATLPALTAAAQESIPRWRAIGIAVPDTFTEADDAHDPAGSAGFRVGTATDHANASFSLASGLIPDLPHCHSAQGNYTQVMARQEVLGWLLLSGGLSPDETTTVLQRTGPDASDALSRAQAATNQPAAQQATWYSRMSAQITTC